MSRYLYLGVGGVRWAWHELGTYSHSSSKNFSLGKCNVPCDTMDDIAWKCYHLHINGCFSLISFSELPQTKYKPRIPTLPRPHVTRKHVSHCSFCHPSKHTFRSVLRAACCTVRLTRVSLSVYRYWGSTGCRYGNCSA